LDYFVSVVIPVYNAEFTIRKCLKSIYNSEYKKIEVIVVDDASQDDSVDIAEDFDCKIIKLEKNAGAANARNIGAQKAKGDIIFFTDSDCTVLPDTISKIIKILKTTKDISAVIGSYTMRTPIKNFISTFHNLRHHYTHQTSQEKAMTFWTGCGAIKRKIFNELGGFNINYKAATIEDIEFGYRVFKAGYKIQLNKDIFVTHHKRFNLFKLMKTDVMCRAIPWTKLMLETGTFRSDLNTTTSNGLAVMLVYLSLLLLPLGIFIDKLILIPIPIMLIVFGSLNIVFYKWVFKNFGFWVGIRVMLMSFVYFFYSGLGFMGGFAAFFLKRLSGKPK